MSPLLFPEHLLQQSLFLRLTPVPHQTQPLDNERPFCTSRAHCVWFFPCRTSATFLVMPTLCNRSLSHWSTILFRSSFADVVPITAAQPGAGGAYRIPAISLRDRTCSEALCARSTTGPAQIPDGVPAPAPARTLASILAPRRRHPGTWPRTGQHALHLSQVPGIWFLFQQSSLNHILL